MELCKKYFFLITALIIFFANFFIFQLDWQNSHRGLTFAMLDIGQGDSFFIESPTGTHILIDSGPPKKILGPLSRIMPIFNKKIDAIIMSHPDQDHVGGFTDVLKNYSVEEVFEPGILDNSKTYQNLETEIKNKNIPDVLLRKGMRLDLGGGAVIDILFPDRDVSNWPTNEGSVVARLSYGKTSVMLTGDAPKSTEKIILSENPPSILQSTILKVGHHGSRASTSLEFTQAVSPKYAFISVGKNNIYGHPTQDVLDILKQVNSQVFRTDQLSTVIMKSDGDNLKFIF